MRKREWEQTTGRQNERGALCEKTTLNLFEKQSPHAASAFHLPLSPTSSLSPTPLSSSTLLPGKAWSIRALQDTSRLLRTAAKVALVGMSR